MASSADSLRNWIKDLESIRDADWQTAFVETEEKFLDPAHAILWEAAERAIASLQEYNLPEFKEPLRTAVMTRGCIILEMHTEDNIRVTVDLDATAGNIEDYAAAVKLVRARKSKGSMDKQKASWFWANFIYGQAREGKLIKQRRKKGSKGRTPGRQAEGKRMYAETISERLSAMGTLAPFWSLIDKGNASVSSMNEGGTPYPTNSPTNFTSEAEVRIRSMFVEAYHTNRENLSRELETAGYGGIAILEEIPEPEMATPYTSPSVIQRLKIGVMKFVSRLFRRNT